jgi:hypothetical protein
MGRRFVYDLLEPGLAISATPENADDLAETPFAAVRTLSRSRHGS